jgi:ABC-type uncharacterized transport system permease subunit
MGRRSVAWLLVVPLTVVASQVGHELSYRLVAPDAHRRAHLLEQSGHDYLQRLPFVLALVSILVLFAFVANVRAALGRRAGLRPTLLPFAALPILVFASQEHLERLLHDGTFPVAAITQPTFVAGLFLQIPFALLAYALARLIVRAAHALGAALGDRRPRLVVTHLALVPSGTPLPRLRPLSLGYAVRGPPAAP